MYNDGPTPILSKKKIIIGAISFVLLMIIVGFIIQTQQTPKESSNKATPISYSQTPRDERVANIVNQIKESVILPHKLNDITTLEDITANGDTVKYSLTVTEQDITKFRDISSKAYVLKNICSNNDTKATLGYGIKFEFMYNNPVIQEQRVVLIEGKDCE
ncbi:hypothetical protein EOL73_02320 [Candidatus Saccharibacteria bacterium]|nr:hypothetical protein [Candidatus Saccharibacteria bacterium]NCU40571.1 hypothetical protein [Candidatus Saccharibacteria bacterium]